MDFRLDSERNEGRWMCCGYSIADWSTVELYLRSIGLFSETN